MVNRVDTASVAPPSPRTAVQPRLRVVPPAASVGPAAPVDRVEGAPSAYAGQRIASVPEPRVQGPTPDADRPVPRSATIARGIGAGAGALAIGGGIALAVAISLPLGIVLAIIGLIALITCVALEQRAQGGVAITGRNHRVFEDFSGEVSFRPEYYHRPNDEEEIAALLRSATRDGERVKVIGSGHSFVGTFATEGHLVSLERLNHMQVIDRAQGLVSVGAGAKLRDIREFLAQNGLAFSNLGGITEQSIVGAVTTGTHGSGATHGIIATQVERMRLMTADGNTQWLSRTENPELFSAALVGLGGLGVVTEVVLRTVPAFNLEETVTRVPYDDAFNQTNIERRLRENDHFQMIWMPHCEEALLIARNRTTAPAEPEWSTGTARREEPWYTQLLRNAGLALTGIQALRPALMRAALGTQPRTDHNVGRSDLILSRPLPPRQRETEWAFPVARTEEVMRALTAAIEREGLRMNFPGAVRFVRGDDILMSPANRGDSVYFSTLLHGSTDEDDRVMRVIQRTLLDLGGRPHWGKENEVYTPADARAQYGESYDRYTGLLRELDPAGIFRNRYLDRLFPR